RTRAARRLEAVAQYVFINQTLIQEILNWLGKESKLELRTRIQQEVSHAVRDALSPEQAARFDEELQRRNHSRQMAMVQFLIVKLDEVLCLSPPQREQLSERLFAHWEESWESAFRAWQGNEEFFPEIPGRFVVPLLDSEQAAVWSGIQKISGGMFEFD